MNATKQMDKLDKRVRNWIKQWLQSPINKELFLTEPSNTISEYIESKAEHVLLAQASLDLSIWHIINHQHILLSGNSESTHLGLASLFSGQSLAFNRTLKAEGFNVTVIPYNASLSLGLAAAAGQKDEFKTRHGILVEGLTSPLLDFSTANRPDNEKGKLFAHLWFMLELPLKSMNIALNRSDFSYPTHPHPYERALQNWNTNDEGILQVVVSEMADYHLANTTPTTPDDIAEFDYEYTMLFPFEIITFLQVRSWHGLSNPEKFDHPLMNHPLARRQPTIHMQLPINARKAIKKFRTRD